MVSNETNDAVMLPKTEAPEAVADWLAHWTAEIATGDPDELTFEFEP